MFHFLFIYVFENLEFAYLQKVVKLVDSLQEVQRWFHINQSVSGQHDPHFVLPQNHFKNNVHDLVKVFLEARFALLRLLLFTHFVILRVFFVVNTFIEFNTSNAEVDQIHGSAQIKSQLSEHAVFVIIVLVVVILPHAEQQ